MRVCLGFIHHSRSRCKSSTELRVYFIRREKKKKKNGTPPPLEPNLLLGFTAGVAPGSLGSVQTRRHVEDDGVGGKTIERERFFLFWLRMLVLCNKIKADSKPRDGLTCYAGSDTTFFCFLFPGGGFEKWERLSTQKYWQRLTSLSASWRLSYLSEKNKQKI